MIPKSGSATSGVEQENKGQSMREKGTKRDEQAADYRAEATAQPAPEATRIHRVTLECVHRFAKPPAQWDWWRLMELRPGESVRVVEETHFDDLATVAMERDAAICERESLREQLESVACRAATAETALEAAAKLAPRANDDGGSNHAAPAASGGGVIRDMTDILRSDTADADEKHAAMATLVEAVCPGWVLAPAASGGGEWEPVAWGVRMKSGSWKGFLFPTKEQANRCAELITDDVVALWAVSWTDDHSDIEAEYTYDKLDQAQEVAARNDGTVVPLHAAAKPATEWVSFGQGITATLAGTPSFAPTAVEGFPVRPMPDMDPQKASQDVALTKQQREALVIATSVLASILHDGKQVYVETLTALRSINFDAPSCAAPAASGGGGLTPQAWGVVLELHDAAREAIQFGAQHDRLDKAIAAAEGLLAQPRPAVAASGGGEGAKPELPTD
jgi:hypothetical protein